MKNDIRGAAIVRSVAQGNTLKAAAESIGVGKTSAGQLLRRYCKRLGLPGEVQAIHGDPASYLKSVGEVPEVEKSRLATMTIRSLVEKLKLQSADQLTPKYLANITPVQLRSAGVSLTIICELQAWLHSCGYSLKRQPPGDPEHVKAVERAINLLDTFFFDVSVIRNQFANLMEADG